MHCKQQEQLTNIVGFSGLQNTGVLALPSFDSCTKRRLEDAHTKIKWGMSQGQTLANHLSAAGSQTASQVHSIQELPPIHSTVQWNGNMRHGNHPGYKFNLYMHCLFNNNYTPPGSGMELEADLTSLHIVPSVS